MRKKLVSIVIAAVLAISAAFPARAEAIPSKFRNCPSVQQNGITYLLYKNLAIVRKTPNRETVTIPNTIKVRGKKYLVRAIWDHTFEMTPKLRTIKLKATSLECIEDPAIFTNHKIKVVAYDKSTFKWLKRSGVNVTLH